MSAAVPGPDSRSQDATPAWSGVRRGPLVPGEWVRLLDAKGRKHNIRLDAGATFHTNKGGDRARRPDRP